MCLTATRILNAIVMTLVRKEMQTSRSVASIPASSTLRSSPSLLVVLRFRTANNLLEQDPFAITIEGSKQSSPRFKVVADL
jgi:hypothetical protein